MSWGVKSTCFKAPGVSLGGSGVSIGGVRSLRVEPQIVWKTKHTDFETMILGFHKKILEGEPELTWFHNSLNII